MASRTGTENHSRRLPEWGKTRQTWYVYIKSEGFTRADTNQSGTRGKLAHEPAVGAYRVTWISADGSSFGVELLHWMRAHYANKFKGNTRLGPLFGSRFGG